MLRVDGVDEGHAKEEKGQNRTARLTREPERSICPWVLATGWVKLEEHDEAHDGRSLL
jgi:hypothetical protein